MRAQTKCRVEKSILHKPTLPPISTPRCELEYLRQLGEELHLFLHSKSASMKTISFGVHGDGRMMTAQ